MSKWYEVQVQMTKTFAVEVSGSDTAEDAENVVIEELFGDDWNSISVTEQPAEQVDSLMRHTDSDKIFALTQN